MQDNNEEHFKRELGLLDGTMLVVGSMIGSGIFIVSSDMTRNVGSAGMLILMWVVPVCDRLLSSQLFQKALRASLASLGGLMTAVAAGLGASLDWTWPGALLGLTAFAALRSKIDVLWVILAGTAAWLLSISSGCFDFTTRCSEMSGPGRGRSAHAN